MRFGVETQFDGGEESLARVARLAEIGYQYIQLSVDSLRTESEPEAYYAVRRALNRAALRPEVYSWGAPDQTPLVGDDVHWPATEKHLALALERIEETGGQTLTFPSQPGVQVPADYPVEDALNQIRYFLGMAADYAGSIHIALAEILNPPAGSDDPVPPAREMVTLLGRTEIRLLLEGPGPEAAVPTDLDPSRVAQVLASGDDPSALEPWLESLMLTGYAGRVTIRLTDWNEDAAALALEAARRARGT